MIKSLTYDGRHIKLINSPSVNPRLNVFTLIVGKNGTGKSRLLAKIAADFISRTSSFSSNKYFESELFADGQVFYTKEPSKLIAVSTSPFDRFPLLRSDKKNQATEYIYLGIRDLMTRNFGLAYMSKIIGSLIEVILQKRSQIREITRVLEFLGYADNIEIRIDSKITQKFVDEIIKYGERYFEDISKIPRPAYMGFNRFFFLNEDGSVSNRKVAQLVKVLSKLSDLPVQEMRTIHIEIDSKGIHRSSLSPQYMEDFIFLLKCGLIRLRNVTLTKLTSYTPFPITEASSGEQSVVLSILGIASQIENNSIICIDEPEICLHPEWQERYIKILTSTFSMFSGCHFIIATHSPQIVSNLESKNSYILSLETDRTTDARKYVGHSSDFQLANVFKSPGFKNEYLSRIALNIFAKVSRNKLFDEEDIENYRLLQVQNEYLSQEDPVYQLYQAINEMYQIYGRH